MFAARVDSPRVHSRVQRKVPLFCCLPRRTIGVCCNCRGCTWVHPPTCSTPVLLASSQRPEPARAAGGDGGSKRVCTYLTSPPRCPRRFCPRFWLHLCLLSLPLGVSGYDDDLPVRRGGCECPHLLRRVDVHEELSFAEVKPKAAEHRHHLTLAGRRPFPVCSVLDNELQMRGRLAPGG